MNGGKGIGLAVGIVVLAMLVLLPALLVPTFYLFVNVLALVTGRDFSSDTVDVSVLLVGLVVIVASFLLLTAGGVALIGRGLSPKRRRDESAAAGRRT